ncbi:MAG: MarR family transcriptional regulator [Desulfuromonas sp.]|nr:MAG: MarR family transcriptional regulator [Desulfuromonas sp.]
MTQSTSKNRDQDEALSAYVKLMRAAGSITHRVHGNLAEEKLSVSQFGVLEALYHLGPVCQRDLARKILKSSGNLTMVVRNLEQRKLVKRTRSSDDRRYYQIQLTTAGRDLIERLFPAHASRIADEFKLLDQSELEALQRICRKLGLQVEG